MSESKAVTKILYIFLIISFSSGFSIICFTDLRQAPTGKIIQFKAKAYPYKWPLRTGLLVLLLLITVLAFVATFKEIHRLNIVLAVLIFILLIVEVSFAVKHLTWRNEQTHIVKQQGDGNTMLQQYGLDPAMTRIMDYVQTSYSCCGITDYRDWASTNWAAKVVSIQ
jgi:Ca2+/Na+ antiporter